MAQGVYFFHFFWVQFSGVQKFDFGTGVAPADPNMTPLCTNCELPSINHYIQCHATNKEINSETDILARI